MNVQDLKISRDTKIKRYYFKTKEGLGVGLFTTLTGQVILDERIGEDIIGGGYTFAICNAEDYGSLRVIFNQLKSNINQ